MSPGSSRERWIAGGLIGLAIALRFAHLVGAARGLFFHNPIIDEQSNVGEAMKIATGHGWSGAWEFWKPPLYSYLLGAIFAISGDADLWLPRVVQALLDGATVWLTWRVGRRLLSPNQGLAAAALVAVNGPLIYFTGELTSTTLATFLWIASLAALLDAGDRPVWWRFGLAGLVLGLSALTRAESVLVVPVVIGFAAARGRAPAAAAVAGAMLIA